MLTICLHYRFFETTSWFESVVAGIRLSAFSTDTTPVGANQKVTDC